MMERAEAARLAEALMDDWEVVPREKGQQWHFGYQDLRYLLDCIYGGPPKSDTEKILKRDKRD